MVKQEKSPQLNSPMTGKNFSQAPLIKQRDSGTLMEIPLTFSMDILMVFIQRDVALVLHRGTPRGDEVNPQRYYSTRWIGDVHGNAMMVWSPAPRWASSVTRVWARVLPTGQCLVPVPPRRAKPSFPGRGPLRCAPWSVPPWEVAAPVPVATKTPSKCGLSS